MNSPGANACADSGTGRGADRGADEGADEGADMDMRAYLVLTWLAAARRSYGLALKESRGTSSTQQRLDMVLDECPILRLAHGVACAVSPH